MSKFGTIQLAAAVLLVTLARDLPELRVTPATASLGTTNTCNVTLHQLAENRGWNYQPKHWFIAPVKVKFRA